MQGRTLESGLDCVGLAAFAFDIEAPPARYALRGGDADAFAGMISACGPRPIAPEDAGPGDLLMVDAGACQLHLLILGERGFIHADARLRRIAEVPGAVPWPVLRAWKGQ